MAGRKPMIQKITDHILLINQQVPIRTFRAHVSRGFTCLIFDLTSPHYPYPVSLMNSGSATAIIDGSYSYLIGLESLFCRIFWELHAQVKRICLLCTFPMGKRAHYFTQLNLVYVRWYWATKVYFLIFINFRQKEKLLQTQFLLCLQSHVVRISISAPLWAIPSLSFLPNSVEMRITPRVKLIYQLTVIGVTVQ